MKNLIMIALAGGMLLSGCATAQKGPEVAACETTTRTDAMPDAYVLEKPAPDGRAFWTKMR